MLKLKTLILSYLAKLLALFSKLTGQGSGTSLPGLLIERHFIEILPELVKNMDKIIMISGTNGKTTTRALLVEIYEKNGVDVCTNRGGANILRGIAASLLLNLNFKGEIQATTAILEVEEATLPILTKYIKPNQLVLTNVFRDQLDVYGEIDKTIQYFASSLENLGFKAFDPNDTLALPAPAFSRLPQGFRQKQSNFQLFFNSDDPKLVGLIERFRGIEVYGFGLDLDASEKPNYESKISKTVPIDGNFIATNILTRDLQTSFTVRIDQEKEFLVETKLLGKYNLYNVLAAFLVGYTRFQIWALNPIAGFWPVFGRGERIKVGQTEIVLFLVKNPAGFDEVLKLVTDSFNQNPVSMGIIINDNIADGKDVSWLWDIHLEDFLSHTTISSFFTGGTRSLDMLLRLEYANAPVNSGHNFESIQDFLDKSMTIPGPVFILATYTGMLEYRKLIGRKVKLPGINSTGF